MEDSQIDQLKKDWIVLLASTSGIMLTISLMVLTIVYTTPSDQIPLWQRAIISLFILLASVFLMLCAHLSLRALGALIGAVGYDENEKTKDADRAHTLSQNKAKRAQAYFRIGIGLLVISVFLTFAFLSWPVLVSLINSPNSLP
jgi:hypothetical protein